MRKMLRRLDLAGENDQNRSGFSDDVGVLLGNRRDTELTF
jgi:hypothetical protein